jgi:outer membrane protein TolC
VQKATAAWQEAKDAYIPNLVMGGNPGYVYGYPLGYPSLFTATAQSILVSGSQRDYIRAAHEGVESAALSLKDAQQQVALDIALDYVQLDHDLKEIAALEDENGYAQSLVRIEQDRVQAGVDPRISELQAELTAAQIDEKRIHLENDADAMRQKIAHLTGLPAAGFTTIGSSIPPAPSVSLLENNDPQTAPTNPSVAAAYANAQSKLYTAFGDQRQNYRPLVTLGAQYSLFEKFANYTQYYPNGLQYNNAAVGVVVTFPFFDFTRRAKARESSADAAHARADADASLNILTEQTSAMRASVRELTAQQRVAQVNGELAQEQLKTVETEVTNGTGTQNGPPVSPAQAQRAHIEERERFEEVLDSDFSLVKVELNLLRATGRLDAWVQSSLK